MKLSSCLPVTSSSPSFFLLDCYLKFPEKKNSDGMKIHNKEIERQIHDLSKIVLSQEGETRLVRIYENLRLSKF